jgi:hypothetical protein
MGREMTGRSGKPTTYFLALSRFKERKGDPM